MPSGGKSLYRKNGAKTMKKLISLLLAALLTFAVCLPAFAMAEGERRLVLGADLTEAERAEALEYFGVTDDVPTLTVTNADERRYFEGKLPDAKIGHVSLSSIYIVALPEGSGLDITTHNVNYVTAEMYESALISAGITDASISIWAPHPISGTAALTGVYIAYEDITGHPIDEQSKQIGIAELIATGKLAELVGSEEALEIIREVKKALEFTKYMSDEEVMEKIYAIAEHYKVAITEEQAREIFVLVRTFEGMSAEEIQERLVGMAETAEKAIGIAGNIFRYFGNRFRSIGELFRTAIEKIRAAA